MTQSVLGRTEVCTLVNKSGGNVAQGDVVVVDAANAASFTTTTTVGYLASRAGVVLDPGGIANNVAGRIAFSGYVPKINLSASASLLDFVRCHSVAKQGTPHASPNLFGDFAEVLATGTSPAALLLGSAIQTSTGGGAFYAPTGLTGATQASRYVGATAAGAPVSGTFAVGDFVIDRTGTIFICTSAGSPGTWAQITASGSGRVLIAQNTPSGTGTSSFTSISGAYKKLILEMVIRSTKTANRDDVYVQLNADSTAANYSYVLFQHWSSSAIVSGANRIVGDAPAASVADTQKFGFIVVELLQYANTSFKKIMHSRNELNADLHEGFLGSVYWNNAAAVTQLDVVLASGNFVANSVLRLYGAP